MLYLVSTPIGHLSDITLRALETLRSVHYILCEDTRVSRRLLQAYEIQTPLRSFHAHNEKRGEERIVEDLKNGLSIALISDAGTPVISDPGERLVRRLRQEGLPITAVPGPSAPLTALVLSGWPASRFQFVGFLPKKPGAFEKLMREIDAYPGVSVAFETPHRILKSLQSWKKTRPTLRLLLAKELTKKFERTLEGTPEELLSQLETLSTKGEWVVLFHPV